MVIASAFLARRAVSEGARVAVVPCYAAIASDEFFMNHSLFGALKLMWS
jgi:hypothetical protein